MINIFITRCLQNDLEYLIVKNWLDNHYKSNWKNMSVLIEKPDDIAINDILKTRITNNIKNSSIVIILSGKYFAYSNWIDYAIDESIRLMKFIIGTQAMESHTIPPKIIENIDLFVDWNQKSLIQGLEDLLCVKTNP